MKASEARQISMDSAQNGVEDYRKRIDEQILRASKSGKRAAYIWELLPKEYGLRNLVKINLESDGYEVKEFHDQREGSYCTVSW